MRKTLISVSILLLCAAFAVAQRPSTTTPSAPATGSQPTAPGEQATPATPAAPGAPAAAMPNTDDINVIEGCLGGSSPNFTVTDKTGTSYKLDIPPGADASVLSKHIGESVQVQGNVTKSNATSDSGMKSGGNIAVMRIGKGASPCSGSTGMSKPQSDTTGTDKMPSDKPSTDKPPKTEKPMSEEPPAGVVPKPPKQ